VRNFWNNLKKPFLVLAPMYDVTDFVFREIISEIAKPDVLFTEFVNTNAICSSRKEKAAKDLLFSKKQRPIVAQIWGTNPDMFFKAAQEISKMGFDGIDINMGCPERSVVKNGSGAALIKNPNLAKELIKATKEGAKNIPISVKTRIGYSKIITEEWTSFLLEQNLNALTIHGRIANKSDGKTMWNEIKKVASLRNKLSPRTIIIGNGDVKSYKEALGKYNGYKVDGVMIGRGILSNPWVFKKDDVVKHSKEDLINLLLKHTKLYEETWKNTKNFNALKKFFKVYVREFKGSNELRQELMKCQNYNQVVETIKELEGANLT